MNEFYAVIFYGGDEFFFKDREKAFAFLWQTFLNSLTGRESEVFIAEARNEMYEFYIINNFGEVRVVGFED